MDFNNLTAQQNQTLFNVLKHFINKIQYTLSVNMIDLTLPQIHKAINQYFKIATNINATTFLANSINCYCGQNQGEEFIEIIKKTIDGHNMVGRILMHVEDPQMTIGYIKDIQALCKDTINNQKISSAAFIDQILYYGYLDISDQHTIRRYLRTYVVKSKIEKHIKQWFKKQQYAHTKIVKKMIYNKDLVDKYYQIFRKQYVKSPREKFIVVTYEQYISRESNPCLMHNSYQLIQYLMIRTDEQFLIEFGDINDENVSLLAALVKQVQVNTLDELRMKACIAKHTEYNEIEIQFSEQFKLEDIPDSVIIDILDNIENRLQLICSEWRLKLQFLIIRRVSDNKIVKSEINKQNVKELQQLFQECNDGEIYDIIIKSEIKFQHISDIKLRYLSYIKLYDKMDIILNHPANLISASLQKVNIANITECVNLNNIYSKQNAYFQQDMIQLHSIKRICSVCDKYQNSKSCMIFDLFQNNKLEYIKAGNWNYECHIVGSMVLSKNISNLRCLRIDTDLGLHVLQLDTSSECPASLRVYDVILNASTPSSSDSNFQQYQSINNIKNRLIHRIKVNGQSFQSDN